MNRLHCALAAVWRLPRTTVVSIKDSRLAAKSCRGGSCTEEAPGEHAVLRSRRWLAPFSFALTLLLSALPGMTGEFVGRVVDASNNAPIEGAQVSLDRVAPDGTPEYTEETNPFGFFTLPGVANGTYQLRIAHPAFTPRVETVTIPAPTGTNLVFALSRAFAEAFFDIQVQVADVTTGQQLGGGPVALQRFVNAADAAPAETRLLVTDTNGFGVFRGMRNGHYSFNANVAGTPRAFWEGLAPAGKTLLIKEHLANFLLKPIPRDLSVRINGYNPVTEANGSLSNVIVEITGVDPRDPTSVLVPTRAGVTDAAGLVTFKGLPAIHWKVVAKRLGYTPLETVLTSASLGGVPVALNLTLPPHELLITLNSPYAQSNVLNGLEVRLQGMTNSNTSGIERILTTHTRPDQRLFANLLPGRYRVSVAGSTTNASVQPHFVGEDEVEVPAPGRTEAPLDLDVVPAKVRGRLFAADRVGVVGTTGDAILAARPIYRPKATMQLEVIEYQENPLLMPQTRTNVINTDEGGEFALSLLPARYGLRLLSLSNYWGSHVILQAVTPGAETNPPVIPVFPPADGKTGPRFFANGQGWPFFQTWPFAGRPPKNGTLADGEPLKLSSGEYGLDLFVRTQHVTIFASISHDHFEQPTRALLLQKDGPFGDVTQDYTDLVHGGGMAKLLNNGTGAEITAPIVETGANLTDAFLLPGVPPGSHTLSFTHPRFDFSFVSGTGGGGPSSLTFSVPAWRAPGVLPASDPAVLGYFEPMTPVPPGGFAAFSVPTAAYKQSTTVITWEHHFYNEESMEYELVDTQTSTTDNPIDYVRPAYTGNRVFANPASLPIGAFTYWLFDFGKWYRGQINAEGEKITHKIFYNGPSNNTADENSGSPNLPPAPTALLTLKAVSDSDPTHLIAGVNVKFDDNGTAVSTSNAAPVAFTGSAMPLTATHGSWVWKSVITTNQLPLPGVPPILTTNFAYELTTDESGPQPNVVLTLSMVRGMVVQGTATIAGGSEPLPGARVQVRDRFGVSVGEVLSQTNGGFQLGSALGVLTNNSQTIYVDVTAPGYLPWRKRYTPADVVSTNGGFAIVAAAALEPLPGPTVVSAMMNRKGLFLPGVSKSGNESGLFRADAEDALTLTWTLTASAPPVAVTLPGFDLPDGSPGPMETFSVSNSVAEVFFIDPRGFVKEPSGEAPFLYPPPDNNASERARRLWLHDVLSGAATNVYHRSVRQFTNGPNANEVVAAGEVKLWKLKPGAIRPVFAVWSQRGSVTIHNAFANAATPPQLDGVRMPPWLAFSADLMGTVAGVQSTTGLQMTESQMRNLMPDGKLTALPKFTANITADADGFVDYAYELEIKFREGMTTPESGFLSFAPSLLGLEFTGKANLGVSGSSNKVFLGAFANVATSNNLTHYLPPKLTNGASLKGSLNVAAATAIARNFNPVNQPYEFELTNAVGGGYTAKASVNLSPVLSKIPTVGPVLLSLDKTKVLQISGLLQGGIGLGVVSTWRTPFPPSYDLGGSTANPDPDPNILRRSFLGGTELDADFDLCFRFGAGVEVQAALGRVGATGLLLVQGPSVPCGFPATIIEPNGFGDWPPVKRINGQIAAEVEAFLDAWVVRFQKKWTWPLLSFDHQFGTEASFELVPMNLATLVFSPTTASAATFQPASSNLIAGFYAAGSVAAASANGDALAFTDIDPATGQMVLKVSQRGPSGTWNTPVAIRSAGGIVTVAMAQMNAGNWVAVWTEISQANVGNPYPTSTIQFSVSDATGASWSAPALFTSLPGVASDLDLTPTAGGLLLAFLHTTGGPAASTYSLNAASFNGVAWSAPVSLADSVAVEGFSAAASLVPGGGGDEAIIAYVNGTSLLAYKSQGGTFTGPQTLATDATRHVHLATTGAGAYYLAYARQAGGFGLLRHDAAQGWQNLGNPVPLAVPQEVHLDFLQDGTLLLSWTEGGDVTDVFYVLLSPGGELLGPAVNLTEAAVGRYSELQILPQTGRTAKVLARYSEGTVTIRELAIVPVGTVAPLRLASPIRSSNGAFEFVVFGAPGNSFRVQRSTNLVHWADFTNVVNATLPFTIRDPQAATNQQHYYRAVFP